MYAARCDLNPESLEPWVLLPNPAYNPSMVITVKGRAIWSGRPLWGPGTCDPVFEQQLAEAITKNGKIIANPVCVVDVKGHLYVTYGATRVRAAKSLGLLVPTIISGPYESPPTWTQAKKIVLSGKAETFTKHFRDPPQHLKVLPEGYLEFWGCVPQPKEPAHTADTSKESPVHAVRIPA